MSEQDNVRISEEIGNMLLLDFLRKYRGSPAISTLTINDILCLIDGAELELRAEGVIEAYDQDETDSEHSDGTEIVTPDYSGDVDSLPSEVVLDELFSHDHDPPREYQSLVESAYTALNENDEIVWKLRSNEHSLTEFAGFKSLKSWVEHCAQKDTDILVSLDGNEWKPYVEVQKNLTVSADSAIEAFKMSEVAGSGSEIVGLEGPGSPDCFKGDPASLVMRTKPATPQPDSSTILWKLKEKDGQNYNFTNFASLIIWASNLDDQDRLPVSIDGGRTWKAYGEVMAYISASGSELTPFEAFANAEVIEISKCFSVEIEPSRASETAPEVASASDMTSIVSTISESETEVSEVAEIFHESVGSDVGNSEQMVEAGDLLSDEEPPDVSDELESVGEQLNQIEAPPVDGVLWKMKGKSGLTYNFHGFEALRKWANHLPDVVEELFISLDGEVWKSYAQVVDLLNSGVQLHNAYEVATPIKFREPSLTEIPKVDLTQCGIERETVEFLPLEVCEEHGVLPVALNGNVLVVAMVHPNDVDVLNLIRGITEYDISRVEADESQIREILKSFYPDQAS
jgi:hypothetical protein